MTQWNTIALRQSIFWKEVEVSSVCTVDCGLQPPPPPGRSDKPKENKLPVILPASVLLLAMTLLIAGYKCRQKCKRQQKCEELTRNKQYDAFVCYCYEGQYQDFTKKVTPRELEGEYDLELCIHGTH